MLNLKKKREQNEQNERETFTKSKSLLPIFLCSYFVFKNILKKKKESELMLSKEGESKDTVKFDLSEEGSEESSSTTVSFAKANNKGKWQIGGKTVQALFNKKDKAEKAAAGLPGAPDVKRIFSFPLNGDADMDDIRNGLERDRQIRRGGQPRALQTVLVRDRPLAQLQHYYRILASRF